MSKDTNIIRFPSPQPKAENISVEGDDSFLDDPEAWDGIDEFEEWQADDHFLRKENYAGLVQLRERRLASRPGELHAEIELGEAYVLNGEYDKALAWLSELHQKVPDHPEIQHLILDALFATGKNEDDFPWRQKPNIVRLCSGLDQCAETLKGKRKPRSVEQLYCKLMGWDYLHFTSDELLAALKQDGRFVVNDPEGSPFSAEVRLGRKGEK